MTAWYDKVVLAFNRQHGDRLVQQTLQHIERERMGQVANTAGVAAVIQSLGTPASRLAFALRAAAAAVVVLTLGIVAVAVASGASHNGDLCQCCGVP